MKRSIYVLALAPFVFAGCTVVEPVPVTTQVTREVVTTEAGVPVGREVVVTRTPPAVRVETQTVAPGASYVWTRGYWRWTGLDYEWVPGRWVVRPRPAAGWVEGRWVRRPGGWVWFDGHWR